MVIVRLAGVGPRGRLHVALERSPFNLPPSAPDTPLRCTPAVRERFEHDPPRGNVVQTVGKKLLQSLVNHPTVAAAVNNALAQPEGCPIYLHMESIAAAEYPWESLFDPERKRFLALQPEWPIGRIVSANYRKHDRYVTPPVRMMAILSAIGVTAKDEWRALRRAIESSPLDVRLRLVVGERELHDEIQADKPDWAELTMLSREDTVQRELDAFDPHLIHFFCHGTARPDPILELATELGWAGNRSNVQVSPKTLKGVAPMAWLATLNCCSGANDHAGVRGLASELVANADYPAAIGMREPITKADARLFCERFYTDVFANLARVFEVGQPADAEWAIPLCSVRNALRNAYRGELGPELAAARNRKWTVPILCVAPAPLTIHPVAIHPSRVDAKENAKKLGTLNTYAVGLSDLQLAAGARAEFQAVIDDTLAELAAPA